MKSFFAWVTETDAIFAIVCVTFFVAFLILAILLRRGGRSAETAATIREIRKVGDQVEGMRSQNTNEHAPMQDYIEWTYGQIRRLLRRFGFLDAHDAGEEAKRPLRPRDDDVD